MKNTVVATLLVASTSAFANSPFAFQQQFGSEEYVPGYDAADMAFAPVVGGGVLIMLRVIPGLRNHRGGAGQVLGDNRSDQRINLNRDGRRVGARGECRQPRGVQMDAGLQVVDLGEITQPLIVGSAPTPDIARNLTVADGLAHVVCDEAGTALGLVYSSAESLARDRDLAWQLRRNPGRLRIQTFDSLSHALYR